MQLDWKWISFYAQFKIGYTCAMLMTLLKIDEITNTLEYLVMKVKESQERNGTKIKY